MQVIDQIFKAVGGATAIARSAGLPVQTVHSWKAKGSIPPWRRSLVLKLPTQEGPLTPEAIAYLRSTERTPKGGRAA